MSCFYVTCDSFLNLALAQLLCTSQSTSPPPQAPAALHSHCSVTLLSTCHPTVARLWHTGERREHSCNFADFFVARFVPFWSSVIHMAWITKHALNTSGHDLGNLLVKLADQPRDLPCHMMYKYQYNSISRQSTEHRTPPLYLQLQATLNAPRVCLLAHEK